MSGDLILVASGLGVGVLSALVPVVNAEAYLLAVMATVSTTLLGSCVVVGLATGQAIGKTVLFLAARQGKALTKRWGHRSRDRPDGDPPDGDRPVPRWRRWIATASERGLAMMDRPVSAAGVLLTSATVGLPPLAVTTVVAGIRRTSLPVFVACALIGRILRFGAMAVPVLWVAN